MWTNYADMNNEFKININDCTGNRIYVDNTLNIYAKNQNIVSIDLNTEERETANTVSNVIAKLLNFTEGETAVFCELYRLQDMFNGGGVTKEYLVENVKQNTGYSTRHINRLINSLIKYGYIIYVESINLMKISSKLYYSSNCIASIIVLNIKNKTTGINPLIDNINIPNTRKL